MYNYHADLVWQVDNILLFVSLFLILLIVLYSAARDILIKIRHRNLFILKKNLADIALFQKTALPDNCDLLVGNIQPLEFVDILRDRELIVPKEVDAGLRTCFASEVKIPEFENIARQSKNKWRRIHAIVNLGYSKYPSSLQALKETLKDKDEDISYFSMLSLGNLKNSDAAKILLDFLSTHTYRGYKIASILESFPALIIEDVIKNTKNPDAKVRFWAIKIMSRLKSHKHLDEIIALADDQDDDVRAAACECLKEIGSAKAEGVLIRRTKDSVWFVRMHAVRALYRIFKEESIPQVISLIGDENWLIRDSVKEAMKNHIEASLAYIEELMQGDSEIVKRDCVEALEASGYIATLLNNILSDDKAVKEKSMKLLKHLARLRAHFGLESALKSFDEERRSRILRIISNIDSSLAEHIEKRLRENWLRLKQDAV